MNLDFEKGPCGRCGGSGQYSYCQSYGTKCFDCEGKGLKYTARARNAIAWEKAQKLRKANEVRVGERVKIGGVGTFKVTASQASGTTSKSLQPDGTWKEFPYWEIKGAPEWAGLLCPEEYEIQVVGTKPEQIELRKKALEIQNQN